MYIYISGIICNYTCIYIYIHYTHKCWKKNEKERSANQCFSQKKTSALWLHQILTCPCFTRHRTAAMIKSGSARKSMLASVMHEMSLQCEWDILILLFCSTNHQLRYTSKFYCSHALNFSWLVQQLHALQQERQFACLVLQCITTMAIHQTMFLLKRLSRSWSERTLWVDLIWLVTAKIPLRLASSLLIQQRDTLWYFNISMESGPFIDDLLKSDCYIFDSYVSLPEGSPSLCRPFALSAWIPILG